MKSGAAVSVSGQSRANDIVSMSDVVFAWPGRNPFSLTVDRFDLTEGSRTLLVGSSGSGKSTLLSLLAGIVVPQSGRIEVVKTDITGLNARERDRFRAEHIGVVFQMFNLLPYGSVIDNVLLPLSFAPERAKRADDAEAEARRLLLALGLDEALIGQSTGTLSVGQQQRIAAARALIGKPDLIIADEPTSALDADRQTAFLELVFEQTRAAGSTLLMVSHDKNLAPLFDQTLQLDEIVCRDVGDG